jgi:hypothetical protein
LSELTGLSRNSILKYLPICEELGLLKVNNSGNKQFIGFVDTFKLLGFKNEDVKDFKHVRFYRHINYEKLTLQSVFDQIKKSLVIKNIVQQQYQINKNIRRVEVARKLVYFTPSEVKEISKQRKKSKKAKKNKETEDKQSTCRLNLVELRVVKKLIKEAASKGLDTMAYSKSLVDQYDPSVVTSDNYAVTGKFHAAKLIAMSPASAARTLKQIETVEGFTRNIIQNEFPLIEESLDYLKQIGNKHLHIRKNKIVSILGSVILFDECSAYFQYLPGWGEKDKNEEVRLEKVPA